jgi:hypothetical protein
LRKITITGLFVALIAAFAVAATPALAHEFVAKPGKGVTQDKNGNTHVFESGGAKVECAQVKSTGVVQAEKSPETKETVVYNGCKAFGEPAQVSQAKYLFKAEGTVSLENEVIITAAGPKCEFKVPVAGNANLGTVTYTSVQGGKVEIKANVTGITSTGGGTGPLCVKGTNKTSKYVGASLNELTGGVLEWV